MSDKVSHFYMSSVRLVFRPKDLLDNNVSLSSIKSPLTRGSWYEITLVVSFQELSEANLCVLEPRDRVFQIWRITFPKAV